MKTKAPLIEVALLVVSFGTSYGTFSMGGGSGGYGADQKPTLGKMIGAKIDGIQAFKGMLLSPFLALASGILSKASQTPAPAPAPASPPADTYYAPPPAPSYSGNYGGGGGSYGPDGGNAYGMAGSYTNNQEHFSQFMDSGRPEGTDNTIKVENYLFGDTGKPQQLGMQIETSGLTMDSTGSQAIKRDGGDLIYLAPDLDSYGAASSYGNPNPPYYPPHGSGNVGRHQSGEYSAHNPQNKPATKGIGIGIGLQKNFEITWPTKGPLFGKGQTY